MKFATQISPLLNLLFISADAAQEKEKSKESATAHRCFKVCSPYSIKIITEHNKTQF
jgi:hypothetical protein